MTEEASAGREGLEALVSAVVPWVGPVGVAVVATHQPVVRGPGGAAVRAMAGAARRDRVDSAVGSARRVAGAAIGALPAMVLLGDLRGGEGGQEAELPLVP